MSAGFQYHVQVRINPTNGADEVLDLVDLLTDAMGPTNESVDYRADMGARETVNRRIEVARYGFRPRVLLTCQILKMDDEATIKKILNAFAAFDVRVFLSMDNGTTEREVYLRRVRGPKPLGKKTGIGVEWRLDLETVAPLTELVASDGAGAW